MERIGEVAYHLELPSEATIHNVLYVTTETKVRTNSMGPAYSPNVGRRVRVAVEAEISNGGKME